MINFRDVLDREDLEPERYELHTDEPAYTFDLNRRDFCRAMGGGVLVMLLLPREIQAQEREQSGRRGQPLPQELGAWIRITPEGKVQAYTGKAEVGQGTRTMLSMVVADELQVPVHQVIMVMADTEVSPYDRGTFGSRSTPDMAPQIRRAAAATREALIELAAQEWQAPREQISIRGGKLVRTSGGDQRASFAEITKGLALTKQITTEQVVLASDKWTATGKATPSVTGIDIVTGRHEYPSDFREEGMFYGRILRPPAFDHQLASVDTTEVEKLPGVVVVVRDQKFVGVAAPTVLQANHALAAIKAEWTPPASPPPSDATLYEFLRSHETESRGGGSPGTKTGDSSSTLASAAKKIEATFNVPYIAHVPLETRTAFAKWEGDKLTVWTGTQRPFGVRSELAQAFAIPEQQVRVVTPDTGSGYGGKHSGEVALEAARLAKAAKKPVRVTWTREEESTWAYFRPAGVIDIKAGVSAEGALAYWEHHNWNSGGSGIRTPYEVANPVTQFHATATPLRQGSYRALASTANNFARESVMDDLAHELGLDAVEFRRRNLKDSRLLAVLDAVAKEIGWAARKKEKSRGFGIACGSEKGGYVATAVEVELSDATIPKILRAVTAFECGAVINPDSLRNQVEGALIQGLGGAILEAIHFEGGKVTNAALSDYPLPRFEHVPPIKCILLDRKDLPSSGAGETPLIAIAPAIRNAIADANGKQLKNLPLTIA